MLGNFLQLNIHTVLSSAFCAYTFEEIRWFFSTTIPNFFLYPFFFFFLFVFAFQFLVKSRVVHLSGYQKHACLHGGIYWCLSGMNRSKTATWQTINHASNQGWQSSNKIKKKGKTSSRPFFSPLSFPVNYSSLLTLEPQKLPFIPITCHLVYLTILNRTFLAPEYLKKNLKVALRRYVRHLRN